jgi:hypothetical protein
MYLKPKTCTPNAVDGQQQPSKGTEQRALSCFVEIAKKSPAVDNYRLK